MSLKLDSIYWLHPADTGNTIRLMQGQSEVAKLNRSSNTALVLEMSADGFANIARHSNNPTKTAAENASRFGVQFEGDKCRALVRFPAINSGSVRTSWRNYHLQRDLFVVPHLMHDGKGVAVLVWSLKDREGWEIGRAN